MVGDECIGKHDSVPVCTAQKVSAEQILFTVKTILPFAWIVPREKYVMQPIDQSPGQAREYLGEENCDIRVLESPVAVVDKQNVVGFE